jgi:hypothetical protein
MFNKKINRKSPSKSDVIASKRKTKSLLKMMANDGSEEGDNDDSASEFSEPDNGKPVKVSPLCTSSGLD